MADETNTEEATEARAKANAEETSPARSEDGTEPEASGKFKRFLVLYAGVVVISAGAGYGAAIFSGHQDQQPQQPAEQTVNVEPQPTTDKYQYKALEPITANLDEPRLARYICATLTLAIPTEEFDVTSQFVELKKPELRDWLNAYFAGCALDDIRGEQKHNRIRREICDAINQQLWPDQKPRISHILLEIVVR